MTVLSLLNLPVELQRAILIHLDLLANERGSKREKTYKT